MPPLGIELGNRKTATASTNEGQGSTTTRKSPVLLLSRLTPRFYSCRTADRTAPPPAPRSRGSSIRRHCFLRPKPWARINEPPLLPPPGTGDPAGYCSCARRRRLPGPPSPQFTPHSPLVVTPATPPTVNRHPPRLSRPPPSPPPSRFFPPSPGRRSLPRPPHYSPLLPSLANPSPLPPLCSRPPSSRYLVSIPLVLCVSRLLWRPNPTRVPVPPRTAGRPSCLILN